MEIQAVMEIAEQVQRLSLAVKELQARNTELEADKANQEIKIQRLTEKTESENKILFSNQSFLAAKNSTPSRYDGREVDSIEKLNWPLPFSGKRGSDVLMFTAKIKRIFRNNMANLLSDQSKVDFIANLLDEKAHKWFINHERLLSTFTKNPQDLLNTLDQTFGESDEKEKASFNIQTLKQAGSVSDFIFKFEELQVLTDFNETALFSFFKNGLKDSVLDALVLSLEQPKTLKTLQEFSLRLDNQIFRRNTEKNNRLNQASTIHNNKQLGIQELPMDSPMVIDTVQHSPKNPYKRLSPEERERRILNKLCIICGKEGHFRNNCPLSINQGFQTGQR